MRFLVFLLLLMMAAATAQEPLALVLPTDNDALHRGGGPEFYMHVDRTFKGVKSKPWEAGQFGFIRDPVETAAGIVYKRFHAGIDIKPVRRDKNGVPLDEVRAIADGEVAHASDVAGYSNYGKYVVIRHAWGGCDYFSLYAHLNSVSVRPGAKVKAGEKIGVLGFTGAGINKERAHLHLELNLMWNRNFDGWHAHHFPRDTNRHGIHNGLNLAALDVAAFYLALRKNRALTVPEFVKSQEPAFRVALPASPNFDLPRLYPWLLTGQSTRKPAGWLVTFDGSGLPLSVAPATEAVSAPKLQWVKKSPVAPTYFTRGLVTGSGGNARLSGSGERLMRLLIWPG